MARSSPHPLVIFSLRPENGSARNAVSHPNNSHLVSTMSDGTLVLDVGFYIRGKSSKTLATLGRGVDADIFLEGSSIAKIQCSFEIDLETGVIMLYDRSFAKSTQVFGENAIPFERERDERKVLVHANVNNFIGMGGERRNLVQFSLEWHRELEQIATAIKYFKTMPCACGRVENPRLAETVDEAPNNLPSRRETRPRTAGQQQLKVRYVTDGPELGSGQFGTVHKAINVDSGRLMAVKILKRPLRASEQEDWGESWHRTVKREVETLSNIKHPHIVEYIASQGWNDPEMEIFMGLKEGTVRSLADRGVNAPALAESVFPQMLRALDYIAWKGIVHRDVKPENILYASRPDGQCQFQLGDFGLCNRAVNATTHAGSDLYMAPEIDQEEHQTHKVDVWSLFVTTVWILDVGQFRKKSTMFRSKWEVRREVDSIAANEDSVSEIREMAIVNPEERASAAQMLVRHYNGEGLTTPASHIPTLAPRAPPTTVRVPPQARPFPAHDTSQ